MFFDIKIPKTIDSQTVFQLRDRQIQRQVQAQRLNPIVEDVDFFNDLANPTIQRPDFSDLQQVGTPIRQRQRLTFDTQQTTIHPESFLKEIWVAELVGLDPKFGFNRTFLKKRKIEQVLRFEVFEGKFYEFSNLSMRGFFTIKNEKIKPMTKKQIRDFYLNPKQPEKINKFKFIFKD